MKTTTHNQETKIKEFKIVLIGNLGEVILGFDSFGRESNTYIGEFANKVGHSLRNWPHERIIKLFSNSDIVSNFIKIY